MENTTIGSTVLTGWGAGYFTEPWCQSVVSDQLSDSVMADDVIAYQEVSNSGSLASEPIVVPVVQTYSKSTKRMPILDLFMSIKKNT